MKELQKVPNEVVSSHIIYRKKHWYSKKQKIMVILTKGGIYETEIQ